ncbi:hypothetical protein AB1E19_004579 [Capra hircus]
MKVLRAFLLHASESLHLRPKGVSCSCACLSSSSISILSPVAPTLRGLRLHCPEEARMVRGDFPGGPVVKNPPASAGDTGASPGLGRSRMLRSN